MVQVRLKRRIQIGQGPLVAFILCLLTHTPLAHALRKAGTAPQPPSSAKKAFTVVVDPGHGGSDHGAQFTQGLTTVAEKDVVLELARAVAAQLELLGIQALLTRSQDADVDLPARTALANRHKADLFLSIHMNSSPQNGTSAAPNPHSRGIETYILNNSTNESSIRLANLENKVLPGSAADAYGKQTSKSPVALIVKDLMLDANLKESKHAACQIQSRLAAAIPGTKDRGVRQGLFYVLLGADMPSVLVEAGFLDNAEDRTQVTTPAGRVRVGKALAQAIDAFRRQKGTATAKKLLSTCKVN